MFRPAVVFLASLLLIACGGSDRMAPPPAVAGGCRIESAHPIRFDEAPLGFSAEDVALRAAVRDDLVLVWDATGRATRLEAGIEAIHRDRVFHVVAGFESIGEVEVPCPQGLTFPARIRFRTADGALDELLEADVFARSAGRHEWVVWMRVERLRGDLIEGGAGYGTPREIGIAGRLEAGGLVGGITLAIDTREGLTLEPAAVWGEDRG